MDRKREKNAAAYLAREAARTKGGITDPAGFARYMASCETQDATWTAAARGDAAGCAVVREYCRAEYARYEADCAAAQAAQTALDAQIARITGGLDEESVLALAEKAGMPANEIELRVRDDVLVACWDDGFECQWSESPIPGESYILVPFRPGWQKIYDYHRRGNGVDGGSGYGRNTDE